MRNPFKKADGPGGPSLCPTIPPSAEKPMAVPQWYIRAQKARKAAARPSAGALMQSWVQSPDKPPGRVVVDGGGYDGTADGQHE